MEQAQLISQHAAVSVLSAVTGLNSLSLPRRPLVTPAGTAQVLPRGVTGRPPSCKTEQRALQEPLWNPS